MINLFYIQNIDIKNQTAYNTTIYNIISSYAMRINSTTGFVKWTKAFNLKKLSGSFNYTNFEITENQIAWILMTNSGVPFIYRINNNGILLQIIWFGSLNLNFSPTMAFLKVISETDFMFVQDLSLLNGNLSVSITSGTDFSIARISIDLNAQ